MGHQPDARDLPHLLDLAAEVGERIEGVDVSVVDGVVLLSPKAPAHFHTRRETADQLSAQVAAPGALLGATEFFHPWWDQRRDPDLVVWEGDEDDRAPYDASLISLAVEIVSPSSVENDYVVKPHAYAAAGIPAYLVLDPYTRTWTLFGEPAPGAEAGTAEYRLRAEGRYGETVAVDTGAARYLLDTSRLPAAKSWQLRDAWPAHRTTGDPATE